MKIKILFVALALIFIAAACNKTVNNNNQGVDTDNKPEQKQEQSNVLSGSVSIIMSDDAFSPSEMTVKKGTTVTFINNGSNLKWPASAPHPTHTDYPEFDPKQSIVAGQSWSFTFDKTGTWKYHDHLNSARRGTIIVVE